MKKIWLFTFFAYLVFASSGARARDLKLGTSGEDVKKWQIFLVSRNFVMPADGEFGPVTRRATRIFQKKWKLYVDGVVGKQTMRKAKQLGYDRIVSTGYQADRDRSGSKRIESGDNGSSKRDTSPLSQSQVRFQVMQYLNEHLHDPESAQILRWGDVVTSSNQAWTYTVNVRYRAKDTSGTYVFSHKTFLLNGQGDIIATKDID